MNDLKELLTFLFCGLVIGILALFLCGAFIVEPLAKRGCDVYGSKTGRNTEYVFLHGCYVEHGEIMIPKSEANYVYGKIKVENSGDL